VLGPQNIIKKTAHGHTYS